MLTEEAHHMFVGDTGLSRVSNVTAQLMKQDRVTYASWAAFPLEIIQKYINFWFSYSLDLFGGEISSNSADFFGGRPQGPLTKSRSNIRITRRPMVSSLWLTVC